MEALVVRKEGVDYIDDRPTYQQLEEEIKALVEMFTDLHDLVYIQQPMLDIIENNISESKVKVEKGEDKLQIAVIRKGRNSKLVVGCIGGLACFAIFGPVGLISKVAVCSIGTGIVYAIS